GPDVLDSEKLAQILARQSVLIEPGAVFFGTANPPKNHFRLGFSTINEAAIAQGMPIIADAVHAQFKSVS
ncbi:MAG: PLP-dependent aminotransferase family protein, partial [Pseudomonadota bacterium]